MMRSALFFIILFLGSCNNSSDSTNEFAVPSGTSSMIEKIDSIYLSTDFSKHPYEFGERVELQRQKLAANPNDANLIINFAYELMAAGYTSEAISNFEKVFNQLNLSVNENNKSVFELLATAYIRQGEQVNCQLNHVAESCIIPIAENAIHKDKQWSQKAINVLTDLLYMFPDDYQNKWLLNICHMTLGTYPSGVPKEHFINVLDKESIRFPKFENVAGNLGLDKIELAGGTILEDFNNDGYLDIVTSSWGMKDQMRIFINDTKGQFVEKTTEAGLDGLTGGLNMTHLDYNNDGLMDIFVYRGAWKASKNLGILPNSLLENQGDAKFEDVTIKVGLYHQAPGQAGTWADFDLDGDLDFFMGNETVRGKEVFPCQLYINENGMFRDIAPSLGLDVSGHTKGVASEDVNDDGFPELYISFLDQPNKLFLNTTQGSNMSFKDVTSITKTSEPTMSFPCWFFDYDNDGKQDLFVSSFDTHAFKAQGGEIAKFYNNVSYDSDELRVFRNEGNMKFTDVSAKLNLNLPAHTMGCNYGDLNQDGYVDFYLGTGAPDFRAIVPNRMFLNTGKGSFEEISISGGFAHIQKGHAIAFADLDNDGDQDVFANMGGSFSGDRFQNALFENPGFNKNFITLILEGTTSNRAAIGAKVRVDFNDGISDRSIYRTVSTGGSFGSNSLRLELGLSNAKSIDKLVVQWPNAERKIQEWENLPVNGFLKIKEGVDEIENLGLKKIEFSKTNNNTHHHHHH